MSWLDDLIGLKADVPFLELPTFEHEEEPLENRTHEFLRRLFPSKKRILKQFGDGKNHWIQRQVIIYGGPGTGKTEFFKWLTWKAVEKYGEENVKAYMARGDLKALLDVKYPSKPVILLFDDDATLEKLDKETVKVFTRIRHKCMDDTGLDSGLAVTVTGLHRFHASNPLIRTNFNLLVVRNPPAGKYDHDFIKFYIGPEGLQYLEKVNELRMKDESYLGHAVFANPYSGVKGVVTNKLVNEEELEGILETVESQASYYEYVPVEGDFEDYLIKRVRAEFGVKVAEALKMRLSGMKLDDIGEHFGVEHNTVSDWFEPLRTKKLGYIFEDWFCTAIGVQPNQDKNKPIPDCITPDGRIYSLKCYMSKRKGITLNPEEECRPEINEALKRGTTFTLLVYNPLWHEAHKIELDPKKLPATLTIKRGDPKTLTELPRLTDDQPHPSPADAQASPAPA